MSTPNEPSPEKLDSPIVASPSVAQAVGDSDEAESPTAPPAQTAAPTTSTESEDADSSKADSASKDSPEAINQVVTKISTELNETNTYLIKRITREIGVAKAMQLLDKTVEIEAGEGIMTLKGDRRRTPGGVFFFLVRGRISKEQYFKIWERPQPYFKKRKPQKPQPEKRPPQQKKKVKVEPLNWPARIALFNEVGGEHGQVSRAELKLIGRPIKILPRGKIVILTLRNRDQPPLPRALPKVEQDSTVFLVFLSMKQWNKIADSMEDESDKVIITGYPVYSGKLNAIAVWAQRATTINMEKARHAAKKA